MRKTLVCSLLAAAGLLANSAVFAAEPEVVLSESVRNKVEATVEYIDIDNRDVKLLMPDGNLVTFEHVDPNVTNFDKLQLNDKVNVGGSESISIALSKGTAGVRKVEESEGRDVTADGVGVVKIRASYSDIVAVDTVKGAVQVKTPSNEIITIPVANKELLAKAAVGDQVVTTARASVVVWGNNNH